MEEVDKGCPMIRMGVSGRMFLLVPASVVCVCVSRQRSSVNKHVY